MDINIARTAGAVFACALAVGLVAGCSTDGSPTKGEDAASVTTPADPAKTHDLVLDASAFPAGYTVQNLPRAQLKEMVDTMLSVGKNATIKPAGCQQLGAVPDSVDFDEIGFVIASKGAEATIGESVAAIPKTLDEYRKAASGKCSTITLQADMYGQHVESTVKQTIADDAPTIDGAETMVVRMDTVARVRSVDSTTRALVGYATVNGYVVTVQSADLMPSGAPDRAMFDDLFTKAVQKVVEKS